MRTTLSTAGKRITIAGTTVIVVMITPVAAWANTGGTGSDFGDHVVQCAQTMGFDGHHNPGMHQGFVGFDPDHTC